MRSPRCLRALCVVVLAWPLGSACRSANGSAPDPGVEATIRRLYDAFGFEAGGEPDWEAQRSLFLEGAAFVPPVRRGGAPRIQDVPGFLSDFRDFATKGEFARTGFHERILSMRIHSFGGVAQAFVTFEGFVPGEAGPRTRGVDGIQFVHDGRTWNLVSFVTQYEDAELEVPPVLLR